MVDKAMDFILDSKNDPVPDNVLLEDRSTPVSGMLSPHSVVENRSYSTSSTSTHDAMLEEMKKTSKAFCDALQNTGTTKNDSQFYIETMNSISQAEAMKEKVQEDVTLSDTVKKRRIEIFDRSVGNLYDKLDVFNKL